MTRTQQLTALALLSASLTAHADNSAAEAVQKTLTGVQNYLDAAQYVQDYQLCAPESLEVFNQMKEAAQDFIHGKGFVANRCAEKFGAYTNQWRSAP